jgi:hypothetical protein
MSQEGLRPAGGNYRAVLSDQKSVLIDKLCVNDA